MSKWGLASLTIATLCMIIVIMARFILGGWLDMLWFPLGMGLVSFVALLITEHKTIWEFLTMRTTKNGMNMGMIILMMIVVLASVNYLSIRYNKTIDLTEEKINSLSEQTLDVLEKIEGEMKILVFYHEEADQRKEQLRQVLEFYSENSARLNVRFYNVMTENVMTQKYVNPLPDKTREKLFAFVEYKGKTVRIDSPLNSEEKVTSAMIKASREGAKTIYFLTNHGEPGLDLDETNGLSGLKKALEDSSFVVKPLDLISNPKVPEDAAVVAVVGPTVAMLEPEMDLLRDYARSGGRLLVAADPGQRHNIAQLTKSLGVEFKNNYILSPTSRLMGRSMASAIGAIYSAESEITNKFQAMITVFDLASEVVFAPDAPKGLKSQDLVQSAGNSFSAVDLENVKPTEQRPYVLGVSVEGSLIKDADPAENPEAENDAGTDAEYAAVVFGDSDFLTNQGLINGLNRDLALNSLTWLAREADLVTIRPKQLKGTQLMMTTSTEKLVVIAGVSMPLLLLCIAGFLWFRRRSL